MSIKNITVSSVRKTHRITDILLSTSILICGGLLTLFAPSWNWLGISLLFSGIIMVPFYRTGYKIKGTEGVFLKKTYLLPNECKTEIASYIEGKSDNLDIDPFNKGGLLLELYYKKDKSKMYGQVFNYESNVYTSQCTLTELPQHKLEALLKHQS